MQTFDEKADAVAGAIEAAELATASAGGGSKNDAAVAAGAKEEGQQEEEEDEDEEEEDGEEVEVEVEVPVGHSGGDTITLVLEDGTELEVVIPDGLSQGETFDVTIHVPSTAAEEEEMTVENATVEMIVAEPEPAAAVEVADRTYEVTLLKPTDGSGFGMNISPTCEITSFGTDSNHNNSGLALILHVFSSQLRNSLVEILRVCPCFGLTYGGIVGLSR